MSEPINRALMVAYTTYDQAVAKGIIWDDPASARPYYNPGRIFAESTVFVPFGKQDIDRHIADDMHYLEWAFVRSGSALRDYPRGVMHLARACLFARRLVRDRRIDVVRANGPHVGALISMWLRLTTGAPVLLRLEAFWETLLTHQSYMPGWLKCVLPYWYKLAYRSFDAYCGTPSVDPEYYAARGMDKRRISPWLQELDLDVLRRAAGELGTPDELREAGHPRLVAVGRLHPEKHVLDLVEVLANLRRTHPQASLVLVGDGEQRDEVMARAGELGVADGVVLLGQIGQAEGFAAISACDIYTAPMQGNALVEAMGAGLPIVAYDHAWHRKLIPDTKTGRLVPYRDTEAMASAVSEIASNATLAERLGKAAKEHADKEFGPQAVGRTVLFGFRLAWRMRNGQGPVPEAGV